MSHEIEAPDAERALALYASKDALEKFVEGIEKSGKALEGLDLEQAKDRQRVASVAYSIARIKSAIDAAGKAAGEEVRKRLNIVNARRNAAVERLQAVQDHIRKPLTDWEEGEARRKVELERRLERLRDAGEVPFDALASEIQARLDELPALYGNEPWHEREEEARQIRQSVEDKLNEAHTRAAEAEERNRQAEAERAELARLRAAEEERRAEDARRERERLEAERIKREEEARAKAAEEARLKAEAEAKARIEAAEEAKKEAERRAAEAEERAKREAEERRKLEEARGKAEEERKAATDRQIKAAVTRAEVRIDALLENQADAQTIIAAIREGEIPHVRFEV